MLARLLETVVRQLTLLEMTSLCRKDSLLIHFIQYVRNLRIADDGLFLMQASKRVDDLERVHMVSQLFAPVMVMELLVFISVRKHT